MKVLDSDLGRIVKHRLTKEKVMIIGIDHWNLKIKIRRPDYTILDVGQIELEALISADGI